MLSPVDFTVYVYFYFCSCDRDTTIRHYNNGSKRVQRFSIQPSSFLNQHQFVYIHCNLIVCSQNYSNRVCVRDSSCPSSFSLKMSYAEDSAVMYALSLGPLMFPSKHAGMERCSKRSLGHSKFKKMTIVLCLNNKCSSHVVTLFGLPSNNITCTAKYHICAKFEVSNFLWAILKSRKRPGNSEVDNAPWGCF